MKTRRDYLKEKLQSLNEKLRTTFDIEDMDNILSNIKQAEQKLFVIETTQKIETINKREAKRKSILKDWLEVEHFDKDILTDDLRVHKTKIKKYPKLQAFISKYKHTYFRIGYDGVIEMNTDGYSYRREYTEGSGNERKTFLMTGLDLKEACTRNGIQFKDKNPKKVISNIQKAKKETAKLKALIEKSQSKIEALGGAYLKHEGFVNTYNEHLYLIH